MTKNQQIRYLLNATKLIIDSGVCPESDRDFRSWWEVVKFAHTHGYLYLGFQESVVDLAVICYRIKEFNDKTGLELPETEEGDIAYVPVAASKSNDKLKLYNLLKFYKTTNPVRQIAYHYRGDINDLRVHELRSNHGITE